MGEWRGEWITVFVGDNLDHADALDEDDGLGEVLVAEGSGLGKGTAPPLYLFSQMVAMTLRHNLQRSNWLGLLTRMKVKRSCMLGILG
jgi:hypothetical protein